MDRVRDQELDELLEASSKNAQVILPLFARYTSVISGSNNRFIQEYSPRIDKLISVLENSDESLKGLRQFNTGITKFFTANFNEATESLQDAINLLQDSKLKDILAMSHMIYGANSRSLGEFDVAVDHLLKGVEILDPNGLFALYKGLSFYQLAEINIHINDFEAAEKYYQTSIEITESLNNEFGLFRPYIGMANFYLSQNKLDECKIFLDKSLSIKGLTDSQKSRVLCDLGMFYYKCNDISNAEKNLQKSYNIRIKAGLKDAAATSLINLSKTQIAKRQISDALNSLQEAIIYSDESKSKSKITECQYLLGVVYSELGMWQESCLAYGKHLELLKELTSKQLQNIYDLKNRQIRNQKYVIEEAHKEITDSITYAKRIQSAILPSNKIVKEYLKNSFIFYRPKDIVAGDFYWIEKLGEQIYFAAADCTGHGVPGAMVSVICNSALNRSVREYGLTDPGKILDQTRKIVIQEFEKSDDDVKDGMDIALCCFGPELFSLIRGKKSIYRELKYAGANNSLWIVRDHEILDYKADKQPIGRYEFIKPYTTHLVKLIPGDSIYIFTDGFADQFGGDKGRKFMANNFKKLLLRIQDNQMDEQKKIIEEAFDEWSGNEQQVDDVCVIGVRF